MTFWCYFHISWLFIYLFSSGVISHPRGCIFLLLLLVGCFINVKILIFTPECVII